jgi:hypothetical protein
METILHFDKLFYHFSHSGVSGGKYRNREKKKEGKKKLKIVRGDKGKERREKLLFI